MGAVVPVLDFARGRRGRLRRLDQPRAQARDLLIPHREAGVEQQAGHRRPSGLCPGAPGDRGRRDRRGGGLETVRLADWKKVGTSNSPSSFDGDTPSAVPAASPSANRSVNTPPGTTRNRLASHHWLKDNADALGVRYLSWQGRIGFAARAADGWRPYIVGGMHDAESITGGRYDHVHITVKQGN